MGSENTNMFPFLTRLQVEFPRYYSHIPHPIVEAWARQPLGDIPHLLFYGPTQGMAPEYVYHFLRLHLGVPHFKNQIHKHTLSDELEVTSMYNSYFKEIRLPLYGSADKRILSEYIGPIAEQPCIHTSRHIIILWDVDKLSEQAWMCMRRLMETCVKKTLFLMTATSISRLPAPLLSRSGLIRCPAISKKAIDAITHDWGVPPSLLQEDDLYTIAIRMSMMSLREGETDLPKPAWTTSWIEQWTSLKRCRSVWTAYAKIKAIAHNICFHQPARVMLTYLAHYFLSTQQGKMDKAARMDIVEWLAQADCRLLTSHKQCIVWEWLLTRIYERCTSGA